MQLVDAATVKLTATFTEPSRSVDNSVLNDLKHCTIWSRVGTGTPASLATIPATSPAGGGNITIDVLAPAPDGVVTNIDFWVKASDLSGNIGPDSNHVMVAIDRVGPAAPTNFSIA